MQRGEKEAFSCKCKKKLMQLARDFSRFLLASCAAGPRLGRAQVSQSNLTQHGKQFLAFPARSALGLQKQPNAPP